MSVERGHIYVGRLGSQPEASEYLFTVTSLRELKSGDVKVNLVAHVGYGTADVGATWAGGSPPDGWIGPVLRDEVDA